MGKLIVAMAQSTFVLGDVEANLQKVEHLCLRAARAGAGLVVFPEEALTGTLSGLRADPHPHRFALQIPGPVTARLEAICQQYQLSLVTGTDEAAEDDRFYNTAVVVTPQGYQGKFRKVHPAPEEPQAIPGDETPVFQIAGWTIGIGICYDLYFPELTRIAALKAAQAYVIPTGGTGLLPEQIMRSDVKWRANRADFMHFAPARALDNGLYVLVAVAADAGGGSVAVDPFGEMIAYGRGDEELILLTLDPDVLAKARAYYGFLRERRPEVYRRAGLV